MTDTAAESFDACADDPHVLSMVALPASTPIMSNQPVAYGLLPAAIGCPGAGFGLTVPAVNS
jgi:hypothetical protein